MLILPSGLGQSLLHMTHFTHLLKKIADTGDVGKTKLTLISRTWSYT